MGVLDAVAGAAAMRRPVTICLDGATQAQVDAIEARLQDAVDEDKLHGSMGNPSPNFDAAIRDREALRDKIADSEVTFVFEAMDWFARVALQAEHPPRPGNLADLARRYNVETYLPALIRASVVEITATKDGDTQTDLPDAAWAKLLGTPAVEARDATPESPAVEARPAVKGTLNAGQFNRLVDAASGVNEGSPVVPRSALSLLVSQDSGESSTSPEPGTSAPESSTDGSPSTSPTSSDGPPETSKKASAKKRSSGKSASS